MLELGAGFNGELTGRENVYLNASLLGMSRRETDRVFDSIVNFAELEEFIDNPVKHYSSGMYVRLGFAVAVHVDPDMLLVDEVLAVGDEHFARKCLDKIAEFQDDGRTILFVSHGLDLVERICSRGVVLDHGRVVYDGDPYFATGELRKILGTDVPVEIEDEETEEGVSFGPIVFADASGRAASLFRTGDPMTIRVPASISARWRGSHRASTSGRDGGRGHSDLGDGRRAGRPTQRPVRLATDVHGSKLPAGSWAFRPGSVADDRERSTDRGDPLAATRSR